MSYAIIVSTRYDEYEVWLQEPNYGKGLLYQDKTATFVDIQTATDYAVMLNEKHHEDD